MKTLTILGDSITKGVSFCDIKKRHIIVNKNIFHLISNYYDKTVNLSVYGSTITKGISTFKRNIDLIKKSHTIIIEFGGNDCNMNWKDISLSPEKSHYPNTIINDFKNKYISLINSIKRLNKNANIIILNLPPLNFNQFFNTISYKLNENNILKYLKEKESIFKWQKNYSDMVEKISINRAYLFNIRNSFINKDLDNYISKDGMHPSILGFNEISKSIKKYYKNIFKY